MTDFCITTHKSSLKPPNFSFQSEVSFSNNRLCPALTSIGHMLTRLEVLDLYKVKYSQLRLLKMHCKNLEVLAISMVMGLKRVMMSATQIQVKG